MNVKSFIKKYPDCQSIDDRYLSPIGISNYIMSCTDLAKLGVVSKTHVTEFISDLNSVVPLEKWRDDQINKLLD